MHQILAQYSSSGGGMSGAQQAAPLIFVLFMMVIILAAAALGVLIWGTIFKKAGYSFWMALLMIIPIANLVWFLVFAFSKWPIQQELEALRAQSGYPPSGYAGGGFPVGQQPPMR